MGSKSQLPVPEQIVLETSKTTLALAKEKPKLARFGFDAAYFTALENRISTAAAFKTDEELSRELVVGTGLKNRKLEEAAIWLEGIKLRLALALPEAKKEFPSNYFKAKKDEKLMLEVLVNTHTLVLKYETELKSKGLTDEEKAQGLILRDELDELNKAQENLKKRRPEYTAERVAAYMNLYEAVNEINKAGKLAYADSETELLLFKSPWPVRGKRGKETKTEQPV